MGPSTENTIPSLLVSIDSTFEVWKLDAINKIGSSERFISDDNKDNILVSKCEHEFILKQIKAQENEISLLQSELNDKNNIINKVQNDALVLSEKVIKKNNGIDILTKELVSEKLACNKYNTEISTLKSSISNLEGAKAQLEETIKLLRAPQTRSCRILIITRSRSHRQQEQ